MKRPGFSVSTVLFVVILLGSLAYVGSMVNPIKPVAQEADHDHEGDAKKADAATAQVPPEIGKDPMANSSSPERKKFMQSEMEQRRAMYKSIAEKAKVQTGEKPQTGAKTSIPTSLKDPEAIEPTSSHFFVDDMGEQGIEKQRARIAVQKKAFDAAMEKQRKNPLGKAAPLATSEMEGGKPGQVP